MRRILVASSIASALILPLHAWAQRLDDGAITAAIRAGESKRYDHLVSQWTGSDCFGDCVRNTHRP